jgi:hypothetical protein
MDRNLRWISDKKRLSDGVFDETEGCKNIFEKIEKAIDKRTLVWYNTWVNEVKPLGFHPASIVARGSIDVPLKAMSGSLCAGAIASVRFLF